MDQYERNSNKLLIGGKEYVNFEEINKFHVMARIDSGAKTSSIHCEKVWVERVKDKKILCATLLKKNAGVTKFKKFSIKTVKSSNGVAETRYAVRLTIKVADLSYRTEFTLTNRDKMNYPVLLGRKFLRKGFLVDVSRNFILSGEGRSVED